MRLSDNRYRKDLRNYCLARKLLYWEARTQTIVDWTQLSGYSVRTLHQGYTSGHGGPLYIRHRGVTPHKLDVFRRNAIARCQTLTLAGLLHAFKVLPSNPMPRAAQELPELARGERLCRAYELYRAYVPAAVLSIDHAALLAIELAKAEEIRLGRCSSCKELMLIDPLGLVDQECEECKAEKKVGVIRDLDAQTASGEVSLASS